MTNYRNPKNLDRYEDLVFKLETALELPGNTINQRKTGHNFVVDNTGELNPFDWYHARFNVNFKLQLLADGGNIGGAGHLETGIVNSASSLIKKLTVKMNSVDVYDSQDANQATNIKNLLEYSKGYSQSQGTNEFFYIDKTREAQTTEFPTKIVQAHATQAGLNAGDPVNVSGVRNATYNSDFAVRVLKLTNNAEVNAEIPLNRYSFFESLHNQILPNSRVDIQVELESDNDLVWRTGGNDSRVVLTKFELIVPRLIFNSVGKTLYLDNYFIPKKWTYLKELIHKQNSTQQQSGEFRITSGVNRPRHVFVYIIKDENVNSQTANKFLYDTFAPANQTLTICYLEVGNGRKYPEVQYKPTEEPTRVFRDVLKYVHANSEYANDTLLNINNFKSIFPFIYFDLTKQPIDIRDGMTKLSFHYELSGGTNRNYSVYALVLHEQDVEMIKIDGKLILRSKSTSS